MSLQPAVRALADLGSRSRQAGAPEAGESNSRSSDNRCDDKALGRVNSVQIDFSSTPLFGWPFVKRVLKLGTWRGVISSDR